jgi:hypothetical protein
LRCFAFPVNDECLFRKECCCWCLLPTAVPILRCRSLTIEQNHPVGFAPLLLLLQLIRLYHTHPVIGIFYSPFLTDFYVGFE